jgi:hypothetical protein
MVELFETMEKYNRLKPFVRFSIATHCHTLKGKPFHG